MAAIEEIFANIADFETKLSVALNVNTDLKSDIDLNEI